MSFIWSCSVDRSTQDSTSIQVDLDAWMQEYNTLRPHQGRWCYGRTSMQTFIDSVDPAKEKQIAQRRASTLASSA